MPRTRSLSTLTGAITMIAPSDAPTIVRISDGWISAPTWPPASVKPPRTQAITTMQPTMTTICAGPAGENSRGHKCLPNLGHNEPSGAGRLIREYGLWRLHDLWDGGVDFAARFCHD